MDLRIDFSPEERRQAGIWRAAESLYQSAFGDHGPTLAEAAWDEQRRYMLRATIALAVYDRTAEGDLPVHLLDNARKQFARYREALAEGSRTLADKRAERLEVAK